MIINVIAYVLSMVYKFYMFYHNAGRYVKVYYIFNCIFRYFFIYYLSLYYHIHYNYIIILLHNDFFSFLIEPAICLFNYIMKLYY